MPTRRCSAADRDLVPYHESIARSLGPLVNIALIVPGGVDRSGEYRVIPALLALIERLASRHRVHVFALNQEFKSGQWDLLGARVHNLGAGRTLPRAIGAIRREHRDARFDVVQSIWAGACGLVAVMAGALLRIPSVVHIAGGELADAPEIRYGGRLTWKGRCLERVVLHTATVVTAPSRPIIEQAASLGARARRVCLGVDLHRWPPREPIPRDERSPVQLVHVASLNRVKDQTTLLRALARLRRSGIAFHMEIVGEDTLGGEIQALCDALDLNDCVTFRGFLPQPQVRTIMEASHVLIVSSVHEAGPLVVLEAAAVGVPTVGTRVGHVAEWAEEASIAVPTGDPDQLAGGIERLISNEALRLRIARRALEKTRAENADHSAAAFEAIYRELTGAS